MDTRERRETRFREGVGQRTDHGTTNYNPNVNTMNGPGNIFNYNPNINFFAHGDVPLESVRHVKPSLIWQSVEEDALADKITAGQILMSRKRAISDES